MASTRSVVCLSALVASALLVGLRSTRTPERYRPAAATTPKTEASPVIPRAAANADVHHPGLASPAHRTPAVSVTLPLHRAAATPAAAQRAESFAEIAVPPAVSASPATPRDPGTPARGDEQVPRIMLCHLDARGPLGAADELQACIDRAPAFSSVEIPPGTYILHKQIVVSTPLTVRTAGSAHTTLSCTAEPERCAILMAGPDLLDSWGFLLLRSTNNVVLEHLVLDGHRAARMSSTAARWCLTGRTAAGFNAAVIGCLGCALDDVVSKNALCGTGMVWSGAQASIRRSEFSANGDAATPHMWADGLTVVYAPESEIRENRFVDNSDIGLIIGHGVRSRVEQNVVIQRTQAAFAGLMLDNFNSDNLSFRGDFRGAVIANNVVDCGRQLCVFGIQVGPGPWYPSQNIVGGELYSNEVRGAKVGINVDGAGDPRAPIAIFANRVSDVPPGAWFSECVRRIPTDWMNVSPTSVVDRRDELEPTGGHLSDPCQFWSLVSQDTK